MRNALKALLNVTATAGLAVWILTWLAWIPGYAALFHQLIDTAAWHDFRGAVAWLRETLGARVGPESDELMVVQCAAALSLVLAIILVWIANRAIRAAMSTNRTKAPRRIGEAVPTK